MSNKKLVFEIHGTGTHNRGAELMAIAISDKIKLMYPNSEIIVGSTFGTFKEINKYGFYTSSRIESRQKKPILTLLAAFFNKKIINPKNVNVIFDASGFAFSDQWGVNPGKRLLGKLNEGYRDSQLFIMLPQALGSFNDKAVYDLVKRLFQRAEMVFARDNQSFNYANGVVEKSENLIKKAPDFTIAISPQEDNSVKLPEKFVAIVPNIRMLDKSDSPEKYLNFLATSILHIKKNNLTPLFVIHDAQEDCKVVSALGEIANNIGIVQHENPKVLKYILGKAEFVIGSRFHALVSSMSQGVPCIGAGWSHKYPELFQDFSNRDGLIDDLGDIDSLELQIEKFADEAFRNKRKQEILQAALRLKNEIEEMWISIGQKINQVVN